VEAYKNNGKKSHQPKIPRVNKRQPNLGEAGWRLSVESLA
jgi:hypothetical protein